MEADDGGRGPSRFSVHAGDTAAVLDCVRRAMERCQLESQAPVHSCYEAGRDGWWLHCWLNEQGIENVVVDPARIEVNRRARRAKTDRLDGDMLLVMLRRHHAGERVWSVAHEPTPEQEDARRTHRERAGLTQERTAHTNRIRSLLVLHNLRVPVIVGGRDWAAWWEPHKQVPPVSRGEIERESARLALNWPGAGCNFSPTAS
jgi:transposase